MPKLNIDNKQIEEFTHNHKLVCIDKQGIGIQHINDAHPFISYYNDGCGGSIQDLVDLFKFMNDEQVKIRFGSLMADMIAYLASVETVHKGEQND